MGPRGPTDLGLGFGAVEGWPLHQAAAPLPLSWSPPPRLDLGGWGGWEGCPPPQVAPSPPPLYKEGWRGGEDTTSGRRPPPPPSPLAAASLQVPLSSCRSPPLRVSVSTSLSPLCPCRHTSSTRSEHFLVWWVRSPEASVHCRADRDHPRHSTSANLLGQRTGRSRRTPDVCGTLATSPLVT